MSNNPSSIENSPINESNIRKVWHEGEWWYSVIDIIAEMISGNHDQSRKYWKALKYRLKDEEDEIIETLETMKIKSQDNKMYLTDMVVEKHIQGFIQLLQRVSFNSRKRTAKKRDEVINMHPMVANALIADGWHVKHHFR